MAYNAGKKTYTVVRRTKKAVEVREKTSYSNQTTHDPASSKSNCSINSIEFILQYPYCTVTGGHEAGVDLVLIQPCLLYNVNHVVLMLTSIFISKIYIRKGRRFVSKQDQP